jgi:hypothetical protein
MVQLMPCIIIFLWVLHSIRASEDVVVSPLAWGVFSDFVVPGHLVFVTDSRRLSVRSLCSGYQNRLSKI